MKAVGANLHGGAPTPSVEALVSSPSVMHDPPQTADVLGCNVEPGSEMASVSFLA